jgi:hypothetical protein
MEVRVVTPTHIGQPHIDKPKEIELHLGTWAAEEFGNLKLGH